MLRRLFGARGKPDPHQEPALRHRSDKAGAGPHRRGFQRGEINPVRDVAVTRRGEKVDRAMIGHRLQAVTGIAVAPVIHNQHRAATTRQRLSEQGHDMRCLRAQLGHHTLSRVIR